MWCRSLSVFLIAAAILLRSLNGEDSEITVSIEEPNTQKTHFLVTGGETETFDNTALGLHQNWTPTAGGSILTLRNFTIKDTGREGGAGTTGKYAEIESTTYVDFMTFTTFVQCVTLSVSGKSFGISVHGDNGILKTITDSDLEGDMDSNGGKQYYLGNPNYWPKTDVNNYYVQINLNSSNVAQIKKIQMKVNRGFWGGRGTLIIDNLTYGSCRKQPKAVVPDNINIKIEVEAPTVLKSAKNHPSKAEVTFEDLQEGGHATWTKTFSDQEITIRNFHVKSDNSGKYAEISSSDDSFFITASTLLNCFGALVNGASKSTHDFNVEVYDANGRSLKTATFSNMEAIMANNQEYKGDPRQNPKINQDQNYFYANICADGNLDVIKNIRIRRVDGRFQYSTNPQFDNFFFGSYKGAAPQSVLQTSPNQSSPTRPSLDRSIENIQIQIKLESPKVLRSTQNHPVIVEETFENLKKKHYVKWRKQQADKKITINDFYVDTDDYGKYLSMSSDYSFSIEASFLVNCVGFLARAASKENNFEVEVYGESGRSLKKTSFLEIESSIENNEGYKGDPRDSENKNLDEYFVYANMCAENDVNAIKKIRISCEGKSVPEFDNFYFGSYKELLNSTDQRIGDVAGETEEENSEEDLEDLEDLEEDLEDLEEDLEDSEDLEEGLEVDSKGVEGSETVTTVDSSSTTP